MGLGRMMVIFLHAVARCRGSKKVRLRVHKENVVAISLYEAMGYHFASHEGDFMIGSVAVEATKV